MTNFLRKGTRHLIVKMLQAVIKLENEQSIFVKRLRIFHNGQSLKLRIQCLRNRFEKTEFEIAEQIFTEIYGWFWLKNRVDRFMLEIDLTNGIVETTVHDWGVVWCIDSPIIKHMAAIHRSPEEHENETYLYLDPCDWFSKEVDYNPKLDPMAMIIEAWLADQGSLSNLPTTK